MTDRAFGAAASGWGSRCRGFCPFLPPPAHCGRRGRVARPHFEAHERGAHRPRQRTLEENWKGNSIPTSPP